MACKKCGSDWTTSRGNDSAGCPACSKRYRHQARKDGRFVEPTQKKVCEECGTSFTCVGLHEIKLRVLCRNPECKKSRDNRTRKELARRKQDGSYTPTPDRKPRKVCKRDGCSDLVKENRFNYCSKECAGADARELKSAHGGRSLEMRKASAFAKSLTDWDWRKPRRHKKRPPCEHCGNEIKVGASRFCSYDCVSAWKGDRTCENCGVIVHDCHAYSKARCEQCRAESKRKANRTAKKKYGRNHRQRARHHGVKYVSVPVAAIYERDGYLCQLCGKRCFKAAKYSKLDGRIHPRSPTIDHIVAMACGGNHEPGNLQTACFECNSRKGARSAGQLRMEFV
jgi:hypothetical protein